MNSINAVIGLVALLLLQGCEKTEKPTEPASAKISQAELQQFIQGIKDNLIFVEGGEFLMGDFGPLTPEGLPYDRNQDSKPLHKVELSSYLIGKFKVTNYEYQFYLSFNGLRLREKGMANKEKLDSMNAQLNTPAHVDWYEAESYCDWLAEVAALHFALPTEAQWEYAARSRGQFLMVATDDGTYKAEPYDLITESYEPKGVNVSSRGNRVVFAKQMDLKTESFTPLPLDMFPPNPLGLYSMSDNGHEWVKDWYDPDYYKKSPLKDPQGPDRPVFKNSIGLFTKVMRGQDHANPYWGGGINVFRIAEDPFGRFDKDISIFLASKTMRCAVNRAEPVITP